MSWHELMHGNAIAAGPSAFDTNRFGFPVSRVTVPSPADVPVDEVLSRITAERAEVCVVRYAARHQEWFSELVATRLQVILADTLVYWSLARGRSEAPAPADPETDPAITSDALDELVSDVFTGYGTHYRANPRFPADKVLEGYQEWARGSADAGDMLLLRVDGVPAGFATLQCDADVCEVLLAGVKPEYQGRGHYARLLARVENRALLRGAGRVVISTQGHNTNVQKAWARYGFEPVDCFLTVHVMPAV